MLGGSICLADDLGNEVDIREAAEAKRANGKEPVDDCSILEADLATLIDGKPQRQFIRLAKPLVEQALKKRRGERGRPAAAIDNPLGMNDIIGL
jgi:hypothetical protein